MTTSLPPELSRYERQLTDAIRREVANRRSRRRRMHIGAAVGGTATAAAVVGGLSLASSSGPLSPPLAAAAIVRQVEHAVAPTPGQILHVEMTETDSQRYGGTDTREIWLLPVPSGTPCDRPACPAQDLRMTYRRGDDPTVVDTSTDGHGLSNLYDSASNTVYAPRSVAESWQPPQPLDGQSLSSVDPLAPGFATHLQHLLTTGRAHVVGDTTLGSRKVVQIAGENIACDREGGEPPILPSVPSKPGQQCVKLSTWTYDVDPTSYDPVQVQSTTSDSVDGTWTDTIVFQAYEELPAAGNMDVFSLARQHPGARVDTSTAGYEAATAQVDQVERLLR